MSDAFEPAIEVSSGEFCDGCHLLMQTYVTFPILGESGFWLCKACLEKGLALLSPSALVAAAVQVPEEVAEAAKISIAYVLENYTKSRADHNVLKCANFILQLAGRKDVGRDGGS